MGEARLEVLSHADQKPILKERGLSARKAAGRGRRMTLTVCVFNRTRETFLCLRAAAAGVSSSDPEPEIPGEDGIWLAAATGAYSVGALLPVDCVYLDRENRVVQLVEHLHPLQMVPVRWPYASVLQARMHTIFASRTQVGDELLICGPEEVATYWKQIQVRTAWTNER